MIDVKVAVFFLCLNATIPLTSTLGNEYPSSNETSKKNGTVRGDCIACDALLIFDCAQQRIYDYTNIWILKICALYICLCVVFEFRHMR